MSETEKVPLEARFSQETINKAKAIKEKGEYRPQGVSVVFNEKGQVLLSMSEKAYIKTGKEIWGIPQGGPSDEEGADNSSQSISSREFGEEFGEYENMGKEAFKKVDMKAVDFKQDFDVERICEELQFETDISKHVSGKVYEPHAAIFRGEIDPTQVDRKEVREYGFYDVEEALNILQTKGSSAKFDAQKQAIIAGSKALGFAN